MAPHAPENKLGRFWLGPDKHVASVDRKGATGDRPACPDGKSKRPLARPHEGAGMLVLGMGSDVVECLRIAQLIERHGELFLRRVFTSREIEYCSSRKAATQHYAARWAGKNAVLRAMRATHSPGQDWRDVEIRPPSDGQTSVALAGEIRQLCVARGIAQLVVSIAHCRTHATAHALALGPAPG